MASTTFRMPSVVERLKRMAERDTNFKELSSIEQLMFLLGKCVDFTYAEQQLIHPVLLELYLNLNKVDQEQYKHFISSKISTDHQGGGNLRLPPLYVVFHLALLIAGEAMYKDDKPIFSWNLLITASHFVNARSFAYQAVKESKKPKEPFVTKETAKNMFYVMVLRYIQDEAEQVINREFNRLFSGQRGLEKEAKRASGRELEPFRGPR